MYNVLRSSFVSDGVNERETDSNAQTSRQRGQNKTLFLRINTVLFEDQDVTSPLRVRLLCLIEGITDRKSTFICIGKSRFSYNTIKKQISPSCFAL